MSDILWWLCALNGMATGIYLFFRFTVNRMTAMDRIYYPYETKKGKGVFVIRKPSCALEWAFLASFVAATSTLLYKMSTAVTPELRPEARRRICDKYKRFARMSMFATLFPLACYNSADEILAFCKYVAEYYRTCVGLTDFAADAVSLFDDLITPESSSSAFPAVSEPQGGSAKRFRGCHHGPTCALTSSTTPCDTECGGHHCRHDDACVPIKPEEEEKHSNVPQAKEDDDFDMESKYDEDVDPVFHSDSDDDEEIMDDGVPDPQPGGFWSYFPVRSGYFVADRSMASPHENWLDRQINKFRGSSSEHKHDEIMAQRAEAEERLKRGETHFGLGYKPIQNRPDSVWRRIKNRFNRWSIKVTDFLCACKISIKFWWAKYQWWVIGGAAIAAAAGASYGIYCLVNRFKNVPEGGKKKNRGGKKERADRAAARKAVSTVSDVPHVISKGQQRDLQRAQRDREWEEERQRQAREMVDEYERVHGESLSHNDVSYADMNRKQLLDELNRIKKTWADAKDLKEKRARFSAVMKILNSKYPKEKEAVKPEHLQKGSLPFHTPKQFCVKSVRNGSTTFVTCFPYANSVYIPRHGVCGAQQIFIMIGGKEVALTGKGVVLKHMPDWIQYPAPSGMPMNKNLKFRAPEKGEICTLFWVRNQDHTRSTQTVGLVGDVCYLGTDKKLKVVEYSGTSEDGSCGGVGIASKDGYVIGYWGIGSTDVNAKPRFYPLYPNWYEDAKDAENQVKDYDFSSDKDYYNKMVAALNNAIPFESLN